MNLRKARLEDACVIKQTEQLLAAAMLLSEKKLRHVYVLDDSEFPVGVLSLSDINTRVVAKGKGPQDLLVSDVMTTPLHMVDIDQPVGDAYREILAHGTLSVPVVDNGILVGVLSMGEALRLLAEERHANATVRKQA